MDVDEFLDEVIYPATNGADFIDSVEVGSTTAHGVELVVDIAGGDTFTVRVEKVE